MESGEECDDGNKSAGDGCSAMCKIEQCGNGISDPGEQCDNGTKNSDQQPNACRTSCKRASCGDGVVDAGEQCDGTDRCTPECKQMTFLKANAGPITGVIAALLIIFAGVGIVFRKKFLGLVASFRKKEGKPAASLDDIPLDELEMPWHKWDK